MRPMDSDNNGGAEQELAQGGGLSGGFMGGFMGGKHMNDGVPRLPLGAANKSVQPNTATTVPQALILASASGFGLFAGLQKGQTHHGEASVTTPPAGRLLGFAHPGGVKHNGNTSNSDAAHRPSFSNISGFGQGIRHLHQRSRSLDSALEFLGGTSLQPGDAVQAAQDVANLSMQPEARARLATKPVLDTLLVALRRHLRFVGTHLCIAFARTAAETRLAEMMAVHDTFCSTLLELAELPHRSTPAGRALALCIRAWPLPELDEGRVFEVLKRLLTIEQTEMQTDILQAFARISRSPEGVDAMSKHGVWTAMRGER